MPVAALDEVAGAHAVGLAGRDFPLGFRWQSGLSPTRKCVGFVVTDVTDGCVRIDLTQPQQRELLLERVGPVDRPVPLLALHDAPTIRQPQVRPGVAAVADELPILAVGDESARQQEGLEIRAVARALVVEGKLGAVVPDLADPAGKADEAAGSWITPGAVARRLVGG